MTTSIISLPCYHTDCSSCKATMLALHPQLTTRGDFSSFCLRSTDRAQHYRGTISPQWRLPCFFMSSRNQCQHLRAPSSLPSSAIPPQDALPLSVAEEDEEDPLLKPVSVHIPFGNREIVLETGLIGRQASGSVTVRDGETVVYTTACAAEEPSEPSDFLPMTVRYHERFSAAGRTSGGFYKREGRAKDEEILVCRLIDRPLRPMIQKGFNFEIQILSWVFSYDGVHSPEALAITAAGAAMALSTIPLMRTVAAVRIGMVNGDLIVNPTISELESSKLDMILAGTADAVIMIEGYCDFLAEEDLIRAISIGQDAVSRVCQGIEELVKKAGKPKMHGLLQLPPTIISYYIKKLVGDQLLNALQIKTKQARKEELSRLEQKVLTVLTSSNDELSHLIKVEEDLAYEEDEQIVEEGEVDQGDLHLKSVITKPERKLFDPVDVKVVFKETTSKFMRRLIVQSRRRSDGRGEKEIRRIQSLCGLLPRAHGSALFTRGETQALAVTTLGDDAMGQRMDNLTDTYTKRFYFQYTFPPSSVGETGYVGAPTRREIGHGMLAERALEPALPSEEEFPYTIRVESTITESNGSSSMASVCGGYLAMLDAGVPLKCSVAGVAMGLILDSTEWGGDGEPVILSDIIGAEDALGDMDFKVAGSYSGVTAFQMDIKVEGLSLDILGKALMQSKEARHHILEEMTKCRPPPSRSLSKYAILIETIKVEPEKVNILIGTGGKNVKHIIEQSGAENINFNDDGTVRISARSEKSIQCAKSMISAVAIEPMVGAIYRNCLVKSIVPFGCFVEIAPGREGLCHISELTTQRLSKPESFVKVGDRLDMKLIEINSKGQLRFSHRAILLGKAQQEAQGQTNDQEKEKEDTNKEIMQDDVNCSDREVKNEHRELSSASPDL